LKFTKKEENWNFTPRTSRSRTKVELSRHRRIVKANWLGSKEQPSQLGSKVKPSQPRMNIRELTRTESQDELLW